MNEWIAISTGYVFAVVIGHFCVTWVADRLWLSAGSSFADDVRPDAYLPKLVGIVERCLFVAALQLGEAGFIGVWLVLKVAGRWKRWEVGEKIRGRQIDARFFYNVFLIGNGLSIAYAVVGAQLIEFIQRGCWLKASAAPIALLAFTVFIYAFTAYHQKNQWPQAQPDGTANAD